VLVVIHTPALDVLLIRRSDAGTWQSVTGSKDFVEESYWHTAVREVREETGIDALHLDCDLQDWAVENVYDIYPAWRWRYPPDVSRNTEQARRWCSAPANTRPGSGSPGNVQPIRYFRRPMPRPS
jgi:dATP pyrophosphohydrolase